MKTYFDLSLYLAELLSERGMFQTEILAII
jgi:hypothetical protein